MGKVKDGAPVTKATKPQKAAPSGGSRRRLGQFLANLFSASVYKPMQGRLARLYTALGLGIVLALGAYRLYDTLAESGLAVSYGVPAAVTAATAWFVYRLLQYPPFVEFLIATEAEMNKVSWTSREDLYRATTVVLVTVTLMSVYLFGVDWVWSWVLERMGVLRFASGDLGSTG